MGRRSRFSRREIVHERREQQKLRVRERRACASQRDVKRGAQFLIAR
jgi:hypothetical protein